jgi:hypothetical protein
MKPGISLPRDTFGDDLDSIFGEVAGIPATTHGDEPPPVNSKADYGLPAIEANGAPHHLERAPDPRPPAPAIP